LGLDQKIGFYLLCECTFKYGFRSMLQLNAVFIHQHMHTGIRADVNVLFKKVRSEEAADLLAAKVRIAEEESSLLSRKAAECEAEKQMMQLAAIKVSV